MKIFILRHGQAEAYQANDASRRLTEKGQIDTELMIKQQVIQLQNIDSIWASPLVRAQQTAKIAATILNKTVETREHLEPEANVQQLLAQLQSAGLQSVLLVSHLPLVGILANRLCGFETNRIQFSTNSLVGIECDIPASGLGDLFLEAHI